MNRKIRLLIADDHAVVRRGLVLVLRQEADFEVIGEAQDGLIALEMTKKNQPDLVVLDWKMPHMDGLLAAKEIHQQVPEVRTLILSGAPIEAEALDSLDKGVDGFVHKDISPAELAHAIRIVASGRTYLSSEITQALIKRSRQTPLTLRVEPLTAREKDILKLMVTPATYKEIGAQLFIGEETVRTHARSILAKLNQPNRTQAVIAAFRLGLISLD